MSKVSVVTTTTKVYKNDNNFSLMSNEKGDQINWSTNENYCNFNELKFNRILHMATPRRTSQHMFKQQPTLFFPNVSKNYETLFVQHDFVIDYLFLCIWHKHKRNLILNLPFLINTSIHWYLLWCLCLCYDFSQPNPKSLSLSVQYKVFSKITSIRTWLTSNTILVHVRTTVFFSDVTMLYGDLTRHSSTNDKLNSNKAVRLTKQHSQRSFSLTDV